MSEPLQLLLTRRWLALTLIAVAVLVGFALLSHWQWDRAHRADLASAASIDPAPVAVAELVSADPVAAPAYGRLVTVRGEYAAAGQRLVPRGDVYWVVTPMRAGAGLVVPVVRGTVTTADAPPPPAGEVSVQGRVEPYEGDPGTQPSDAGLPPGQLPRLAPSALAGVVDGPLAGGWVALTVQEPTSALPLVMGPSSPEAPPELRWQNATYAVQWVLFAAFVAFLWQRWFRDELRERREEQATREREPAGT